MYGGLDWIQTLRKQLPTVQGDHKQPKPSTDPVVLLSGSVCWLCWTFPRSYVLRSCRQPFKKVGGSAYEGYHRKDPRGLGVAVGMGYPGPSLPPGILRVNGVLSAPYCQGCLVIPGVSPWWPGNRLRNVSCLSRNLNPNYPQPKYLPIWS